jgi:hypothetical protein
MITLITTLMNLLQVYGDKALSVISISTVITVFFKFFIQPRLVQAIYNIVEKVVKDWTKQIQPGANGGESLTDSNTKIDKLILSSEVQEKHNIEQAKHNEDIAERVSVIEERQIKIQKKVNNRKRK